MDTRKKCLYIECQLLPVEVKMLNDNQHRIVMKLLSCHRIRMSWFKFCTRQFDDENWGYKLALCMGTGMRYYKTIKKKRQHDGQNVTVRRFQKNGKKRGRASTLMITRQHDDDNETARWWYLKSSMMISRKFDSDILKMRWWYPESAMMISRKFNADISKVRWRYPESSMMITRNFDVDNAAVRY